MLTNLDFLGNGRLWPPKSERKRLQRYRDNRLLFQGEHHEVFKEIWQRLFRVEWQLSVEIVLNWPKRLSTLWSDLLIGERPSLSDSKDKENGSVYFEGLADKINLWKSAYIAAIDTSRYGDSVFKVRRDDKGNVKISVIPPEFWFPIVSPTDAKEITHHVIAWPSLKDYENPLNTDGTLHVEVHTPEAIGYREYKLPPHGGTLGAPIAESMEENTAGRMLIVHCPGLETSDTVYGMDDYDDLTSVMQELEVRFAQVAKVLDKHGDPKMYGPSSVLVKDEMTGKLKADVGDYWPVDDEESPPGYIVWNAQLEHSFTQIKGLMEQFYMLSETSPAVFGKIESGLAESGSALKRLFMAPLAKVNRVRMNFDPALREVLTIAAILDGKDENSIAPVIGWKDGLPDDEAEQVNMASTAVSAGISSKRSAMKRAFGLDDEQTDEEMRQIEAESKAEMLDSPDAPLDDGGDDNGDE